MVDNSKLTVTTTQRSEPEGLLQREAEIRGVLAEIHRIMSSSLQIDEVYGRFAAQAKRLIKFDRITIATIDHENWTFQVEYSAGVHIPGFEHHRPAPLAGTNKEYVVRTRAGLLIDESNVAALAARVPTMTATLAAGLRSSLAVPIMWRDEVVAVLTLRARTENAFTQKDTVLAERIAARISGAVANAELHATLQRQAEERQVIAEIGRVMSSSPHLDRSYEQFAVQLRRLIPFDRLALSTSSRYGGVMTRQYVAGFEVPAWAREMQRSTGPLSATVMRRRTGVIRTEGVIYPESGNEPYTDAATIAGLKSALAVPLVIGDEAIGALCLRSMAPNAYSARDLAIGMRVADQIAGPIANAQLRSALEREVQDRTLLEQLSRDAAEAESRTILIEHIIEATKNLISYDRLVVTLTDASRRTMLRTYAAMSEGGELAYFDGPPPELKDVRLDWERLSEVQTGGELVSSAVSWWGRALGDGTYLSCIHVPFVARGVLFGFMWLQSRQCGAYDGEQIALVQRLAAPVAQTLERFRLLETMESRWLDRRVLKGLRRSVNEGLPPEELVDKLTQGISKLMPVQCVTVVCLAELAEPAVLHKCSSDGLSQHHSDEGVRIALQMAAAGSTTPLYGRGRGESGTSVDGEHFTASIAAPMLLSGLVVGTVQVRSPRPRMFSERDVEYIEEVAAFIAPMAPAWNSNAARLSLPNSGHRPEIAESLSERDCEILSAMAKGHSNSEIASDLHLAVGTVRNRLMDIYRKLGVSDRAEAAYVATRLGIVQ